MLDVHHSSDMVHLQIKISDHTSNRFRVIVRNVLISFIEECRKLTLSSCCDAISDVTVMKYTFLLDELYIIILFLTANWSLIEYINFYN